MAKGKKQQYKKYEINTLEEACLVLKSLIVPVIIDLGKLERYAKEAEGLLLYKDVIPAEIYDSIHDKVLYQQRELLRFIADHQSSSFSYISVRQLLVKKNYLKRNLNEENRKILNELLDVRNWTFHNAQSLLVSDLEIARNSIPSELLGLVEIKPMLNPVVIRKVKSYSKDMLEGFILHNETRIKQFQKILMEMKKDYEEMYNSLTKDALLITSIEVGHGIQYIENVVENLN